MASPESSRDSELKLLKATETIITYARKAVPRHELVQGFRQGLDAPPKVIEGRTGQRRVLGEPARPEMTGKVNHGSSVPCPVVRDVLLGSPETQTGIGRPGDFTYMEVTGGHDVYSGALTFPELLIAMADLIRKPTDP